MAFSTFDVFKEFNGGDWIGSGIQARVDGYPHDW